MSDLEGLPKVYSRRENLGNALDGAPTKSSRLGAHGCGVKSSSLRWPRACHRNEDGRGHQFYATGKEMRAVGIGGFFKVKG